MSESTKPGLPRVLGPWVGLAVVVGTVIGSGVFVKPRTIAQDVPNVLYVALVWTGAGILTMLGGLALAEVSVLFPLSGGNYVFLREGFGRLAGFLWGWVDFLIIKAASIAALATIFVDSLHNMGKAATGDPWLSPAMRIALIIGVIIVLAAVNIRGVLWGGGLQVAITAVKVLSLIGLLVLPFAVVGFRDPDGIRASLLNQDPSAEFSYLKIGNALLGVLWAYHGWMNIAPLAGEIVRPQRNVPISLIGGMGVIMFLYLGANLTYCLTLSMQEMAALPDGSIVAAVTCERLLGKTGEVLALAAVMISTFGALNGNLLAGPRLVYAMGADGLAPRWLGAIHARFQTPAAAIAILAVWSVTLILVTAAATGFSGLKKSQFDLMTDYAMFGAVIFETLGVTTIFIFRKRLPNAPRAFKCPGYPLTPLIYLLLPAYVLVATFLTQPMEALAAVGFIALGVVAYLAWIRFGDVGQTSHIQTDPLGVDESSDAMTHRPPRGRFG